MQDLISSYIKSTNTTEYLLGAESENAGINSMHLQEVHTLKESSMLPL
jgi:hypothetical protein